MWSYACHPNIYPSKSSVSADFPGAVRACVRAAMRADVPVLFFQGFGGDLRPAVYGRTRNLRERCLRFINRGSFGQLTLQECRGWGESLGREVVATMARAAAKPLGQLEVREASVPLSQLIAGCASDRVIALRRLTLAPDVHLFFVSAEVVCEYALWLRSEVGAGIICAVGCAAGVFGYLPTQQMIAEGGYESAGFFRSFGLCGSFNGDGVETAFKQAIRSILPTRCG